MARIDNLTNFLTDVATSIKAKTGDNTAIPASQFDTKIAGITTGKLSNEEYTKANNDLDNILSGNENALPDTYQEVEYLQSTGTQYINTGVSYANDLLVNDEVVYTVLDDEVSTKTIYRISGVSATLYWGVGKKGNTSAWTWCAGGVTSVPVQTFLKYQLEINMSTNEMYANGVLVGSRTATSTGSGNMYLFASKSATKDEVNSYEYDIRRYNTKIYKNGELIRNFVPCYRKSDNEAGMYDTVNNVFYTNEGTGNFIIGVTENVLPNDYQEVEYLISDGYEYIDTGYAFTNPELKIEVKYRKTSTLGRNVFGVDLSQSPRKMHGNVFRNAVYVGNSAVINDIPQELGVDYTLKFEFKNNVAKWNINGNEYTYNGANGWQGVSDGETDYLFANRGAQSAQYLLIGRIYYAKFYDNNGDLVRNFIPCYRKSDDEPGMYDTVNGVFYINEGTREFAVGADVDVLNRKIERILNEKTMNIKPENIKSGVEILGVVGTYTGN